jgi:UrcA family protein
MDAKEIFTCREKGASMNSMLSKRAALLGFAVLLGGIASNVVLARDTDASAPAITIHYSDLDLAQPSGVEALYRRVSAAAKVVCERGSIRELAHYTRSQKCFDQAMSKAVEEIGVPQLNALYRQKTNRRVG